MFTVTSPSPGVLEANYMWLPSWVGMNSVLLRELGEAVGASVVGKPLDEALEIGHRAVIDFLVARYPDINGFREYLEALSHVSIDEDGRLTE